MARAKRYSAEQIVAKLREHEKLQAQGLTIPQACKRIGISDPSRSPLVERSRNSLPAHRGAGEGQ